VTTITATSAGLNASRIYEARRSQITGATKRDRSQPEAAISAVGEGSPFANLASSVFAHRRAMAKRTDGGSVVENG
jgi:hypothetical protein